jgi:hypothetical protein
MKALEQLKIEQVKIENEMPIYKGKSEKFSTLDRKRSSMKGKIRNS